MYTVWDTFFICVCIYIICVFFVFLSSFPLQLSPSVLWYCWLGFLTCKNRLPYNLYCVGGDVRHCTIQSNTQCEKRFSSESGLKHHMNLHSSKYKCTESNVADVTAAVITWQDTDEVIQERNRLNVLFVTNNLNWLNTSLYTAEFTVERNHTNVTCVTRRLEGLDT